MYTFDGIKFVNRDNGISIVVGDKLEQVQEVLNLPNDKVIKPNDDLSYFTYKDVTFGELTGACSFLFRESRLFRMEFKPSLKEYIRELDEITRIGLYDCVDKAYVYFCDFFNQNGYVFEKSDKKNSTFVIDNLRVTISISRDNESVCVIQEENHG